MTQSATLNTASSLTLNSCFETEVTPHIAALRRYALRLSHNSMDADDLVQDTLFRAFRFWDRFIRGSNARAWLFMILKNQHINAYRVRSRRPTPVSLDDVGESCLINDGIFSCENRTPDQDLFDKYLDDELTNAVRRLGEDYRVVVELYHLQGLSYKQIADQSKLRLGTIKSRLYRGRKLLRAKLREYAQRNRYVTDCH